MRRARAYVAAAGLAARHAVSHRWDAFGRAGFYVVLLVVYAGLWKAVFRETSASPGAGPVEMLWYLALTEWVVLALPPVYLDIDEDVRNGDVAYRLPRPVSYVGARLAEATGMLLVRLAVLAPVGFALAWALAGALPARPAGLAVAVPLGVVAGFVGTVFVTAIGVTAFWLQDCAPVFWIWQKFCFVLGGLVLPLSVYPEAIRTIARWTPFHPLVGGPAAAALGLDGSGPVEMALLLVFWGAVALLLLRLVYRRALRVLDVNGG